MSARRHQLPFLKKLGVHLSKPLLNLTSHLKMTLGLSGATEMPMMSITRHQSTLKLLNLMSSSHIKTSPYVKYPIYSLYNLNIYIKKV